LIYCTVNMTVKSLSGLCNERYAPRNAEYPPILIDYPPSFDFLTSPRFCTCSSFQSSSLFTQSTFTVRQLSFLYHLYRVIHKSLRDCRTLRYSSWDGHAEGEHVNRGKDTPSFCPTLQVLDISTLATQQMSQLTQFWEIPRHRTLSYSLSTPCFVTTAP
jgi:hypothetical protein